MFSCVPTHEPIDTEGASLWLDTVGTAAKSDANGIATPVTTSLHVLPSTTTTSTDTAMTTRLSPRAQRLLLRRFASLDNRLLTIKEPAAQVLTVMNSIRALLRHVPRELAEQVAASVVETGYAAYRQLLVASAVAAESRTERSA
jgi:hypothetical protein